VQANTSLKYGLKSDLFFVEKVQLASFFFSKKGKGVVMLGKKEATLLVYF